MHSLHVVELAHRIGRSILVLVAGTAGIVGRVSLRIGIPRCCYRMVFVVAVVEL